MKLPSIQQVIDDAARTLRRFPLVLAVAAVGTLAAVIAADYQPPDVPGLMLRILYAALLGGPMLIGISLLAEKRRWSRGRSLGFQGVGILLLALYAWSLPGQLATAPEIHLIRLLLLMAGMHLFVAAAPWTARNEVNGFWQYNKTLFLRLLTAFLFTVVLFAGLAIALAAIENLFELNVPGERYLQLWILLLGLFQTWFFLAGIPEDLDALNAVEEYPKGLKIFAQYVLLPLVAVYFVILAAYSGKIILAWSWPYGWVSRLILGFAVTGIFAILLFHPIRERAGNEWMRRAARWFAAALLPLLVMYFLAVMRRLSDYGLTENRYLAILIGVWLAAIALYVLFTGGANIKIIPLSLCVLAFVISVGPWGVFAVSEHSQVARLERLLVSHDVLVDGHIKKAADKLPSGDAGEISAVLRYLREVHGYAAIQPWFDSSLQDTSPGASSAWKDAAEVAEMLGVRFVAERRISPGGALAFDIDPDDVMIVDGYQRVLKAQTFTSRSEDRKIMAGNATVLLNAALDTLTFVYLPGDGDRGSGDTVIVPLRAVADTLLTVYENAGARNVPLELTAVEAASARTRVKVYLTQLQLQKQDDTLRTEIIRVRVIYGNIAQS